MVAGNCLKAFRLLLDLLVDVVHSNDGPADQVVHAGEVVPVNGVNFGEVVHLNDEIVDFAPHFRGAVLVNELRLRYLKELKLRHRFDVVRSDGLAFSGGMFSEAGKGTTDAVGDPDVRLRLELEELVLEFLDLVLDVLEALLGPDVIVLLELVDFVAEALEVLDLLGELTVVLDCLLLPEFPTSRCC